MVATHIGNRGQREVETEKARESDERTYTATIAQPENTARLESFSLRSINRPPTGGSLSRFYPVTDVLIHWLPAPQWTRQ